MLLLIHVEAVNWESNTDNHFPNHKLELVHSDIYGLMSTISLSNNIYFILFIEGVNNKYTLITLFI